MRITSRQLRQIIKEEVENMMREEDAGAQDTIKVRPAKSSAEAIKGTELGKRVDAEKVRADEIVRKLESNAYMNISLGSDISQPFTTPSGKGIIKILVQSRAMPSPNKYEILDQSGVSKLGMNIDGNKLMRAIANRINRRMLPKKEELPMLTFEVKLPFEWSPGKLILGKRGGPVIGFGGGEDFTADMLNGGISLMGIGFR